MNERDQSRLKKAVTALKKGNRKKARGLIIAEVRDNPSNLQAWLWALEVAANDKERHTILTKILRLDPEHQGAKKYLEKLKQESPVLEQTREESQPESVTSKNGPQKKPGAIGGMFRFIFEWFASLPTSCGFIFLFAIIISVAFIYFRVNTSFFGLVGTDFDELEISKSYEKITAEDIYWEVQFEGVGESKYIGTARHAGPIRINEFRILTHDILVTTADFADPNLVETNVIDHKFIWKSTQTEPLNGSIHLIHAVPANRDIYQSLLDIQPWDIVKLTGREIYSVKAYQQDGTFLGTWTDTGCNTLLVQSVSILKQTKE